ncbi:hypothetical protein JXQ31_02700 [candidate division KSB1 bacterium]|nr:hypothetical protein [candidate division KSB1 bacterium]
MPSDKNNYLALCIFDSKADKYYQIAVEPWMLSSCTRDIKFSLLLENKKKLINKKIVLKPVMRNDSDMLCKGFILNCDGFTKEYGLDVFQPLVFRLARQLLANEYIKDLTDLSYGLSVNENACENNAEDHQLILFSGLELTTTEKSPRSMIKGYNGQYDLSGDHLAVFMDQKTEKSMIDYVMQDTSRERAGFLTGQLYRDTVTKYLFLICSGHISMREIDNDKDLTENSSITHFQFNPECFIKASRILSKRNNNKIIVGWYHSHPWYFNTEEKPGQEQTSLFFSQDDLQVHESAFSAPYHVGIVIGKNHGHNTNPGTKMYGWRDGKVEHILYNLVNLETNSME